MEKARDILDQALENTLLSKPLIEVLSLSLSLFPPSLTHTAVPVHTQRDLCNGSRIYVPSPLALIFSAVANMFFIFGYIAGFNSL